MDSALDRTKLFVSYSHIDRPWLDRLRTHLAVLERLKLVHVWSDMQIEVGADWQAIIDKQLTESRLAVLLLSPAFLASDYIWGREMPHIFRHQDQENGLKILPLVARPCAWRLEDKLSQLQARPVDGRALSIGTDAQIDLDLTPFVYEVATRLDRPSSKLAVEGWESARLASSIGQQYGRMGLQIASPRPVDLAVHSWLNDILSSLTRSWIGIYKVEALEIRFRLKITERTGINFKGVIEYVNDGTFTSVDGRLMSEDRNTMTDRLWVQIANRVSDHIALVFRETDYVSGKEGNRKISFNGEYRAILSLGQMSGAWVSQNRLVGWFELEPEVEEGA
jgi:TIR domain